MERQSIDIIISILNALKDAEYHTITGTTLKVANDFHLTAKDMNEIYDSRKKQNTKNAVKKLSNTHSKKKIYTQVQLEISKLRKLKYVKDFPNTKGKGIFVITDKGLKLFTLTETEIKNQISSELKKYLKN